MVSQCIRLAERSSLPAMFTRLARTTIKPHLLASCLQSPALQYTSTYNFARPIIQKHYSSASDAHSETLKATADTASNTIANGTNTTTTTADDHVKSRVLETVLEHVNQHGWTLEAVEAACIAEGLPSGFHTLVVPNGAIDILLYFFSSRNERLAKAMHQWCMTGLLPRHVHELGTTTTMFDPTSSSPKDVDLFLYHAVKYRLEQIIPVISVWPQALSILAMPSNVPAVMGLVAQLVDEIWAQAGDKSTDMKWYAKRLGLAYVYNVTEIYMLQDKSHDFSETWRFLDDRLTDLRSLKRMSPSALASTVRNGVWAVGSVTCNLLGIARKN